MSSQYTYPDFGVSPGQLPAVNPDIAEQSARLGYPSWRRSGKVLFMKNFTTDLMPYSIVHGDVDIIYDYGIYGSCLEIGAQALSYGGISARLPVIPQTSIGFETFFRIGRDGPNSGQIEFDITPVFGGSYYAGSVMFDIPGQRILIRKADNNFYELAQIEINDNQWHNFKVTLDLEARRYRNVFFDAESWRLNEAMASQAAAGSMIIQNITCWGPATGAGVVQYFQSIIITMDEPK